MNPEVKVFLDTMDAMRRSIRQSLEGMDALGLNWNPLPGDANSLYAIVSHLCTAEAGMIHGRVAGRPVEGAGHDAFAARGDDPQELLSHLDEVGRTTRELVGELTSQDLDRAIESGGGRPSRTVREWMSLHQRHTALHLGHIEITRQFYEAGIVAGR